MKYASFLVLFFTGLMGFAQQQINVMLNTPTRDDRFERFNLNLALFELKNDTLLTWDFEGLKKAKAVAVKKPSGFNVYAYGYLFFAGNQEGLSPGFITLLVGNPYHAKPTLFADLNNNFDFTDDSFSQQLPWRGDSAIVKLCIPNTNRCTQVKLTRHMVDGKHEYKRMMNEYYQFTYPNRNFLGMEHAYREQHYQAKSGLMAWGDDSVWVALYDANNNGVYNEEGIDKFVMANVTDTLIFPFDDLYSSTISNKSGVCFVDKNGKQIAYVSAASDGSNLTVQVNTQTANENQTKAGKKLPKFKYINWKGKKHRIAKLRKYSLYIYFGNKQAPSFKADTAALRVLADKYSKSLRVIGFIEVNKSYELSVFGQYGHLNWILAYKDKYINSKLGIRGLPSSIYTKKRRKVVSYNLSPTELLRMLESK